MLQGAEVEMYMHSPEGKKYNGPCVEGGFLPCFFGRTWCKGILNNIRQSLDFGQVTNLSSGHVVARCFMSRHSYLKKIQVQDFCGSRLEIHMMQVNCTQQTFILNVPAIDDKNF